MPHRFALLVGCGNYIEGELESLASPAKDVDALRSILEQPEIGEYDVTTVVDANKSAIEEAVDGFLNERKPEDLAFLYFSGHGLRPIAGGYYFACSNTKRARLDSTAISADFIKKTMSRCRAGKKVLILDCCYGAAFWDGQLKASLAEANPVDAFVEGDGEPEERGFAILAATGSAGLAIAGQASAELSLFTKHLVDGVGSGKADLDGDGVISFIDLSHFVTRAVLEEAPDQKPQYAVIGGVGELTVAWAPTTGEDVTVELPVRASLLRSGGPVNLRVEGKEIEVNVPKGTIHGAIFSIPNQGKPGLKGGKPGALHVKVLSEGPVPQDGDNVYEEITIKPDLAQIGGSVVVSGHELLIPAGTSQNAEFVIHGGGKPGKFGGGAGDLKVTVSIEAKPGGDIAYALKITADEADRGVQKVVQTVNGQVTVTLPPHAPASLTLRGRGELGAYGGPNGDLIVSVEVEPAKGELDRATVNLSPEEALSGCVKHVEGKWGVFPISLPAHTKSGSVTLEGKGGPGRHGGPSGDLLVSYVVAGTQASPTVDTLAKKRSFPTGVVVVGIVLIGLWWYRARGSDQGHDDSHQGTPLLKQPLTPPEVNLKGISTGSTGSIGGTFGTSGTLATTGSALDKELASPVAGRGLGLDNSSPTQMDEDRKDFTELVKYANMDFTYSKRPPDSSLDAASKWVQVGAKLLSPLLTRGGFTSSVVWRGPSTGGKAYGFLASDELPMVDAKEHAKEWSDYLQKLYPDWRIPFPPDQLELQTSRFHVSEFQDPATSVKTAVFVSSSGSLGKWRVELEIRNGAWTWKDWPDDPTHVAK